MILLKLPEAPHSLMKQTFTPPLGLWSMRENSFEEVLVLDAHLLGREEVDRQINKIQGNDVLGLSAQFSTQEDEVLDAIDRYWERFPIVIGGPYGSSYTPSLPGIQVHHGWGERFFDRKVKSFSDLKPPRFSEEEISPYWKLGSPHGLKSKKSRWMTLETSRGCIFSCGFCDMPRFWGAWDPRPLDVLESYLSWLKEERGIEEVFIEDDNVSLSRERFIEICELLKNLNISFSCPNGIYAHSLLDSRVLHALEKSTCWALSLPFETGSRESANLMGLGRKWLTFAEADLLVNDLNIMGIETTGFFVIGYAGETEDDVKRTLEYANSLPLKNRHVYLAAPYPATELWNLCKRNSWLLPGSATYRSALIDTPFLRAERLLELFNDDRKSALERKTRETEDH